MPRAESDAARLIGERLMAARQAVGAERLWVALHAGVDVSNLTKYETGKALPNLGTLIRLAQTLQLDPGELVRGITAEQLPSGKARALPVRDYVEARRRLSE